MSGLEEESPASLIKTLAFFAKLGPGHQDIFEQVRPHVTHKP